MMGRAQFHVSGALLKALVMDVADLPWPKGTVILEEDETEWETKHWLHVVVEHPDIPDSESAPLWCKPSWWRMRDGGVTFGGWNFQEDR